MKILFVNRAFKQAKLLDEECVPRIGDQVGVFGYDPAPIVSGVLWYPPKERLIGLGYSGDIKVIVEVSSKETSNG